MFNRSERKEEKTVPFSPASFKKTGSFGKTTSTLMERVRKLSKKDMAFVAMGLAALITAPVAQYFLSAPPKDNLLTPGFGSREGGELTSLYEPGINALSEGTPSSVGDIVTPLSGRDPMSLIMGARKEAAQIPVVPPSSYRDTLKDVAKKSFSKASRSAGAPTPIPKMRGALRTLSSFMGSGSTRTGYNLPKSEIMDKAKGASSKAKKRSMMGPVASADYKGVANTPRSASKDAYEDLRKMAGNAAGHFTNPSAVAGVDRAAEESADIGGSGGIGQGHKGDGFKSPSNSSLRNSHSSSGETLAQKLNRMRAEAALKDKLFYKYEIKKQIVQAMLDDIVKKGLIAPIGDFVAAHTKNALGMGGSAPPTYACYRDARNLPQSDPDYCVNRVAKLTGSKDEMESLEKNGACPCGAGIYRASAVQPPTGGGENPQAGEPEGGQDDSIVVDENTQKRLAGIDQYLTVASVNANESRRILQGERMQLEALNEKMNAVADNLKKAQEESVNLIDSYINPLFEQHANAVSNWPGEGGNIYQEAGLTEAKIKREYIPKIEGAAPVLLNQNQIAGFNDMVDSCVKENKDETACAQEADQYGGADASVLMLAHLKAERSFNTIYSARIAGRDIKIVGGKVTAISGNARTLANRDKEQLAQLDLDSRKAQIRAAMEKCKTSPEGCKEDLINILDALAREKAAPIDASGGILVSLEGRWLSAPADISVISQLRKVTGISADGANFEARIAKERKAEKLWWEKNDPFVTDHMNSALTPKEELSLVGLMQRGYNVYKGINEYKGRIESVKKVLASAEPHAKAALDLICGDKGILATHSYCKSGGTAPPVEEPEPPEEEDAIDPENSDPPEGYDGDGSKKIRQAKAHLETAKAYKEQLVSRDTNYGCASDGCQYVLGVNNDNYRKMARIHQEMEDTQNNNALNAEQKRDKINELWGQFKEVERDYYGAPGPRVSASDCNDGNGSGAYFVAACSKIPNLKSKSVPKVVNNVRITNVYIHVNQDSRWLGGDNTFTLTLADGRQVPAKFVRGKWKLIQSAN